MQGDCLELQSGTTLAALSTRTTAYVTQLQGPLECPNTAPAATAEPYNGRDLNVPLLTADPVIPGTVWTAQLSPIGHASPGAVVLLLRGDSLDLGPVVSILGGPPTELLVAPPVYADFLTSHSGESGPATTLTLTIPANLGLVGTPWALQAAVISTFIDLSSAVRGTIGS